MYVEGRDHTHLSKDVCSICLNFLHKQNSPAYLKLSLQ